MNRRASLTVNVVVYLAVIALISAIPGYAAGRAKPCAKDLASCPATGCAQPGTKDALVNHLKRTVPTSGTPIHLTLDDFERLQEQTDELVGQRVSLSAQQRKKLTALSVSSGNVAEGDLVEATGYVIAEGGLPRANTSGESVNCRLKTAKNNDFHIPIARQSDDSVFDAIVVEMIPQDRPDGWTTTKLKQIAKEERAVLVRGQLFYDNKHVVNDNPIEPIGGQPARFSLWEIHPVTAFFVCKKKNGACDPKDKQAWLALEDYAKD